ncbi:protein of unknown function [Candidatus Hydrogenisulfobacillus filiaventi]|uniref:Ferredoxin n=1 Tax=Candidatus Hydrogenisulfobacillus filiaventi TaxID=2707344 RepID=A0A6F8ZFK0_9FIRM|nr:protein of unknown function [Candidatus Hydrogenisulfobacillus filiaventi]
MDNLSGAILVAVVGECVSYGAVEMVAAHLKSRWPEMKFRVEALRSLPELSGRPTIVIGSLGLDIPQRPWPDSFGWVLCEGSVSQDGRLREIVAAELDLQIVRVRLPRAGNAVLSRMQEGAAFTRRALLQQALFRASPALGAPRVQNELCLSGQGCQHCVLACHDGAISLDEAGPKINPEQCSRCGACVADCPTGALESSEIDDRAWLAMISELVAHGQDSIGITCSKARDLHSEGPVLLIGCIGEIGWHHLVTAAARGVHVEVSCPDMSCQLFPKGAQASVNRSAFVQQALGFNPSENSQDAAATRWERIKIAIGTASLSQSGVPVPSLGYEVVCSDSCDACGACVSSCPQGVIKMEETEGIISIAFATNSCAGCGACVTVCPKDSLSVVANTHWTVTPSAGHVIREISAARCTRCGRLLDVSTQQIEGIQKTLREHGFPEPLVQRMQLCERCKNLR